MLGLIKSLYTGTMSAVKVNDLVSDWFPTEAGVRQGQNDSPTLFLAYIDSLAKAIKDLHLGVTYGEINVSLLMYADDIVLMAESEEALQRMLDELYKWCNTWNMVINTEKTQEYTILC